MNWHRGNVRTNKKKVGMKSNGLYNKQPRSPLTDNTQIGESYIEVIQLYIHKYKCEKGKKPTTAHLNKYFGLRASTEFYRRISQ